jgi:hypothetical protein
MPNEQSLQTQLEQALAKIKELEASNAYLLSEKSKYERGDAKLYYALQRKMTEMSKVFNSQDLSTIDMVSKSDATFERLFKLLEKCEVISKSAESLGAIAGITGDEGKDTAPKIRITPESIAGNIGNTAGSTKQ